MVCDEPRSPHSSRCWVSVAGGVCEHRVGCFFSLEMKTWADVLLAVSVMQAAADDMCKRLDEASEMHKAAAKLDLVGLRPVHQAPTPHQGWSRPAVTSTTTGSSGGHDQAAEVMDADLAALQAAGVANATTLFAPPMLVIYEEGDAPPPEVRARRCDAPLSRGCVVRAVRAAPCSHTP